VVDQVYYEEAIKNGVSEKSMDDEIDAIENNRTWDLMDLPKGKDVIGVNWVYKIKYNVDGKVQKQKEKLVARGFTQQYGVDYNETFAPVAHLDM
ncbi:hypothetical protein KI387_001154, partial [Taxus chinensis]